MTAESSVGHDLSDADRFPGSTELRPARMARLAVGREMHAGAVLVDQEEATGGGFVVLSGALECMRIT
jgi:hypothetical protein